MKNIFYIVFLLLASCSMLRKVDKQETDTKLTENSTIKTVREGDTVRFQIPMIKYKDTTIYTVNRQGTTLRTVFDKKGGVSEIECLSSRIDILETMNRELLQAVSEKKVENETETKGINLNIIIVAALGFIFLFFYKKF